MDDRTGYDSLAFYLAYVHPLFMLTTLALAFLALRLGLRLRSARRRGARRDGRVYARHLRLAKLALALLPAGFAAGIASAVWLRGWDALASAHGWVGTTALVLFLAAGWRGRALERRASEARDAHALLGVLAALIAAAAIFTGFVLLP